MTMHNPVNERIKRQYFAYMKEANRQSEASVDASAAALARFEEFTKWRDFKLFHYEQAIAFKRSLSSRVSDTTGEKLSKATLHATLTGLSRFFRWLAGQPGYKSRLQYSDADYFNLSEKDVRIATARRETSYPTLEQVKQIIAAMPAFTEIEQRNRAVVAFTLLTGARDGAVASMKLKHVDLEAACVHQDARDVKTKFSKTFQTFFFPVGDDVREIVRAWINYLLLAKHWGHEDPLFPATETVVGSSRQFEVVGLRRAHWSTAEPIRDIFREACANAGQPYFRPHSLRRTLVQLGQSLCKDAESFKVWSQNLGHESVLTTFSSYGAVSVRRQGEILANLSTAKPDPPADLSDEIARRVARLLREGHHD
jgi:integrase